MPKGWRGARGADKGYVAAGPTSVHDAGGLFVGLATFSTCQNVFE
jgi:hypothetical protein